MYVPCRLVAFVFSIEISFNILKFVEWSLIAESSWNSLLFVQFSSAICEFLFLSYN
jgi:hypothetical protein